MSKVDTKDAVDTMYMVARPARAFQWLLWLVVAHVAVTLLHSAAHFVLGIVPPPVESAFIFVVIVVLPVVTLPFALRGSRMGMATLTLAFAASWLYGMVNHFVIEGADHVTGLDHGVWPATFTVTGVLLLILEAAGTGLAAWLLSWLLRQPRVSSAGNAQTLGQGNVVTPQG